ncbi:MAG: NAD(P)-binding protein [Desulfurococcales archaeon]|nr:NAD(P)-binding protein [Desulfurococcales archaeon]
MEPDVLIAGAGVAGAAAAYFLASRGFRVVAFDRMSSYGKACGDALTLRPGIYRLVDETESIKSEVRRYSVYVNGVEASTIEYPSTNWIIVDKTRLVNGLRELASVEGASIVKRSWNGERGLYTIDARGPYSWGLNGSVMVFRFIAKARWEPDYALLDFRVDERGFYWVFPADFDGKIVNIGGGFEAVRSGNRLRLLVADYAKRFLGSYEVLDERGAPVTIWSPIVLNEPNGVLRVGEAAGLVVSTAGEGNRPAIQSARALSDALSSGGGFDRIVSLYRRGVRELVDEVKTSRLLLKIVSRSRSDVASDLLFSLPRWFWMEYFRSRVTMSTVAKLSVNPGVAYRLLRALLSYRS